MNDVLLVSRLNKKASSHSHLELFTAAGISVSLASRICQVALPRGQLITITQSIGSLNKIDYHFRTSFDNAGLAAQEKQSNGVRGCDWLSSRFVHLDILIKHAQISRDPALSL